MRLSTLEYREFSANNVLWEVKDQSFVDVNLIVGKNALGKTRLLRVLRGLARLIDGTIPSGSILSGYYKVLFVDDGLQAKTHREKMPDISYEVEIFDLKVQKEKLIVGGEVKLDRGIDGRGVLVFEEEGQKINVNVPVSTLAVFARRDARQHSFFEALHEWARNTTFLDFVDALQNNATVIDPNLKREIMSADVLVNQPVQVRIKFAKERYGRDFESAVIDDMRRIGYLIKDFGIAPYAGLNLPSVQGLLLAGTPQTVYVEEDGVGKRIGQEEMSSGMFRSLSLLILLHIIRLAKIKACVLIDDIGEGCDFDRSSKLIEIVIKQAERGYIQLIMSTNDRFVMNGVPLEYWSIIQRDGSRVRTYNIRNSEDVFREFEEYGFNNFDFFARGFFSTGIDMVKK